MKDVLAEVQALLHERCGLAVQDIGVDQRLERLGIDSLAAIELMFALEDRFGTSLSDVRRDLATVGDVVAAVELALAGPREVA